MTIPTFLEVLKWTDEDCRAYLEARRWPNGPICPKCGAAEPWKVTRKSRTKNTVTTLYSCRSCKKQFTATVGTIFEDSKIPLAKWFAAIRLMNDSKKGISAHQLHRELGITYKSAWFMCHRIREAMGETDMSPLSGIVEADETYVGGKPRGHSEHVGKHITRSERMKAAWDRKTPVLGMVERGGRVRSKVERSPNRENVQANLKANIDLSASMLITDEHSLYQGIEGSLPHGTIRHKSEYVRGAVHTQTIESNWAILKRGLYGTFHHVDAGYLGQYLNEFDFRFNRRKVSDGERFESLMGQVSGRRVLWFCQTPQPENPYA